MSANNNIVGIIIGKKDTGKTWLLNSLIPVNQKTHYILDYSNRFHGEIHYRFKTILDKHLDNQFHKRNDKPARQVVCRFGMENKADYYRLFEFITIIGNCVLVVDEVQLFIKYGKMNDKLYEILTAGRNKGIDILFATISPIGVDKMIFRQADWVVVFTVQEDSDLDYLMSLKMIRSKVTAEDIENLDAKKHERFVFGDTSPLVIPQAKTFNRASIVSKPVDTPEEETVEVEEEG